VYVLSESGIIGETSTIFKVVDEYGETAFFKNLISSIKLGNTYSLRNPPSFMNLAKVELRDAEYEGKLQLSCETCTSLTLIDPSLHPFLRSNCNPIS
jgi:hypothetical protein